MKPKGSPDPEYPTSTTRKGSRKDKRNLIDVWLKAKPVGLFNFIVDYCLIPFKTSFTDTFMGRFVCVSEQKVTLCLAQKGV